MRNFSKNKILQASDTKDVNIDISDRREVNKHIVDSLVNNEITLNKRLKNRFLIRTIFCFLIIALFASTIIPIVLNNVQPINLNGIKNTVLEENQLHEKINDILLPSHSDFFAKKIVLYESETDPIYVEIIMEHKENTEETFGITILLNQNYEAMVISEIFNNVIETHTVNSEQYVYYKIDHAQCISYVKTDVGSYSYYFTFNSTDLQKIFEIIQTL